MFYSLCPTTYRFCKLAVILKFRFYLEICTMRLVNKNSAYRSNSEIRLNCTYEQRFVILKVRRNVISTVI